MKIDGENAASGFEMAAYQQLSPVKISGEEESEKTKHGENRMKYLAGGDIGVSVGEAAAGSKAGESWLALASGSSERNENHRMLM
jgi:hypothetical protein